MRVSFNPIILTINNGLQGCETEHQAVTRGIFYCRESANMKGCGSLQTSSWLDSEVLRNRQQKHTTTVSSHLKKKYCVKIRSYKIKKVVYLEQRKSLA
jgi:hypothetical protein